MNFYSDTNKLDSLGVLKLDVLTLVLQFFLSLLSYAIVSKSVAYANFSTPNKLSYAAVLKFFRSSWKSFIGIILELSMILRKISKL